MDGLFVAFLNSLTALTICLGIGFVCRKTEIINDNHTAGMTNLLVRIAMPATVFMSLMRPFSRELLLESLATVAITGVIYVLSGYLGLFIAKIMKATPGERQAWQFGVAFGNVGFMGIPIVTAVFGQEAIIYVAMALTSFNLLAFTLGARMFDDAPKEVNIKNLMIKNPAIPAVFIGFGFFLTGLRLPSAVEGGIELIGTITTPMSMVLLGVILAKQSLKDAFTDAKLLPAIGAKLIIVPIVTLLVLRWFVPNQLMLSVIVTLMAMPPAALAAIFAQQFDADAFVAAKFVVVGTVLCVVTVPLISLLL